MLGTSGLQIAAGLDEDDGYAPFGSATPEPANRNGFGHEQRRPYAEEQQGEGDDGSEAGRQSDVYNETEADADEGEEQARLIDELVRQLLYARHELEQRAAELESRDCQIRYLQEALVAKENACNRLQTKLDTLSQALGSRLARVTCALGNGPRLSAVGCAPPPAVEVPSPSAVPKPSPKPSPKAAPKASPRLAQHSLASPRSASALAPLDVNGLALQRPPTPASAAKRVAGGCAQFRGAAAACQCATAPASSRGSSPSLPSPPLAPPAPASARDTAAPCPPAAAPRSDGLARPRTPETRQHSPSAPAHPGAAQRGAQPAEMEAVGEAGDRASRGASAAPAGGACVPRGILFGGLHLGGPSSPVRSPHVHQVQHAPRPSLGSRVPKGVPSRAHGRPAKAETKGSAAPMTTGALRRAMSSAHGLLASCPPCPTVGSTAGAAPSSSSGGGGGRPYDGEFAAKLLQATREAREAEAASLAVKIFSRRLSRSVQHEVAAFRAASASKQHAGGGTPRR